jgi:hypothetical protein
MQKKQKALPKKKKQTGDEEGSESSPKKKGKAPLKPMPPPIKDDKRHTCFPSSAPCMLACCHPPDFSYLFVQLFINHRSVTKLIALDCEMVGVGIDGKESMLARVCIINSFGNVIYDKFVKPR